MSAEQSVPYIDRGEPLPGSYGENCVVGMVRGPDMIYVYWDVASEVRIAGNPLVLRTCCLSEGTENDTEPGNGANSMYFHVTPNRAYRFALYERALSGELCLLAESGVVATPVLRPDDFGGRAPVELTHAVEHPLTRREGTERPRLPRQTETATDSPQPMPAPGPGGIGGPFYQSGSLP